MREKIEDEWKNTKTSRIESNFYFFRGVEVAMGVNHHLSRFMMMEY
jgi:hypothetical protein